MFEVIRHALGLCGEGHISLVHLLCGGFAFVVGFIPWLKYHFKYKKKSCNHEHPKKV